VEKVIEQVRETSQNDLLPNNSFAQRRANMAKLYDTLPTYGSATFWQLLEGSQEEGQTLPLEVLVKVLREAVACEDEQTQRRLFEIIIARLQTSNERWVQQALGSTRFLPGECKALAADLYADLCELLLRLLRDPAQHFWEEQFMHSLYFVRKHVYERFMRREGHWHKRTSGPGKRIPYTLLESLERASYGSESDLLAVPDERAEAALLAVEREDITGLVLRLPLYLRTVVWLVFWEGYTLKTVAQLLKISDRTVRNRLRIALAQLRQALEAEQEVIDGKSA
jgi:DNA-directed RNA polymerase specialized sigma24 family protein